MDFRQLECFVVVADQRSFARAARLLFISPQTVSDRIATLEHSVGSRLFDRSPQYVELTIAGRILLPRARSLLLDFESLRDSLADLADSDGAPIRIGVLDEGPAELLPPLLSAWSSSRRQGASTVRPLSFSEAADPWSVPNVDVIFQAHVEPRRGDIYVPLFAYNRHALVSRRHRLAEAKTVRVADLIDDPVPPYIPAHAAWLAHWQLNEARGGPPRVINKPIAANRKDLLKQVASGAVVTVPSLSVRVGSAHPEVCAVAISDATPTIQALLVPARNRSSLTEAFAHLVAQLAPLLRGLVSDAAIPATRAGR